MINQVTEEFYIVENAKMKYVNVRLGSYIVQKGKVRYY